MPPSCPGMRVQRISSRLSPRSRRFNAGQDDDVELQALGLVNGHHFDARSIRRSRPGKQSIQLLFETRDVLEIAGDFDLIEAAQDRRPRRRDPARRQRRRPAQRVPVRSTQSRRGSRAALSSARPAASRAPARGVRVRRRSAPSVRRQRFGQQLMRSSPRGCYARARAGRASVRPHQGARSTASHAVRSARCKSARVKRDEVLHHRPSRKRFDLDRGNRCRRRVQRAADRRQRGCGASPGSRRAAGSRASALRDRA